MLLQNGKQYNYQRAHKQSANTQGLTVASKALALLLPCLDAPWLNLFPTTGLACVLPKNATAQQKIKKIHPVFRSVTFRARFADALHYTTLQTPFFFSSSVFPCTPACLHIDRRKK